MDQLFLETIQKSNSILVLLPTRPYLDQVAAGLSLYLSLRNQKDTMIVCPSDMTVEFNRLVGVNKIKSEVGTKNLVITFKDYEGKRIERVSADLVDGLFKLTVIPKPSFSSPTKEQIDVTYSGVACDTVILIGGANSTHFPILQSNDLEGASIFHIGIRPLDVQTAISSFVNDASSVSEVVSSLIVPSSLYNTQMEPRSDLFVIDADSATNLLMGIESSTNNLTSDSATADTFYYVSELMRKGALRNSSKTLSPDSFPPGSIPSMLQNNNKSKPVQNEKTNSAPVDWLAKPKIYKGTNLK